MFSFQDRVGGGGGALKVIHPCQYILCTIWLIIAMWLWFYAFVLDFRLFVGEIIIVTKGFGQDYPFCPVSHHWPDPVACPNVCQRTRPSTLGMSDLDSIAVLLFTNRWWIPNSLYCSRGFQIFYSGLFASTFGYQIIVTQWKKMAFERTTGRSVNM